MTSKTDTIKNRINEITASTRKYRRQYAPSKWQLEALEAAGLLEHMPAGFGSSDADAVCKDARIGKYSNLETQAGAGDEVWTRDDAGLFFILSEDDDDSDDPGEVARYDVDDDTYIVIRNGNEYELDAEWSDGPAAIWDHTPTEDEVIEVHTAAMQAFAEQDAAYSAESAILDDLEQVMTVAEVAAEYGITVRGIRATIERGSIPARQSGATWLVRREDAEARWA